MSGNKIVIISIQTDMDILLVNSGDLSIEAKSPTLTANAVIIEGALLNCVSVEFTKIKV